MAYKSTGPTVCVRVPSWYAKDLKEGETIRVTVSITPDNKEPIVFQSWHTLDEFQEDELTIMYYVGKGGIPPPPPPPPDGN